MSKIEKALKKAMEQSDVREGGAEAQAVQAVRALVDVDAAVTRGKDIGMMSQPTDPLTLEERLALKIISPELADAPSVKVFRELRTQIGQRVPPDAVIMITGVGPRCGASFVSLNLATAIAFENARTALLVDCNLRDPSLTRLLQKSAKPGLTDHLESEAIDVADVIQPTGIERLRFVPAGQKADERREYFTMEKTRRFFDGIAARYPDRQVILDAPPITVSADTRILASFCDYVLVVVPYGRVTQSRLQSVIDSIEPGKLLGMVLNDEPGLPGRSWWRRTKKSSSTQALAGVQAAGLSDQDRR